MAYRIEIAGYHDTLDTLADVAAWVADLKVVAPSIIGQQARVTQGERLHGGSVHFASSAPFKVVTVSE